MADRRDVRQVAAGYDVAADYYDERHGAPRSVARFRIVDAPQLAAVAGAERVLELGCGTGRLLRRVRAPIRVGIDVSPRMLERAPAYLSRVRADAHHLPFAAASFDGVIAGKGTFRYLDYGAAFAECARVLAGGGRVAVHEYSPETGPARALLAKLRSAAAAAALAWERTHLWRSIRFYPYALPVPAWLPVDAWSHCVMVFRKP